MRGQVCSHDVIEGRSERGEGASISASRLSHIYRNGFEAKAAPEEERRPDNALFTRGAALASPKGVHGDPGRT